MSKEPVGEWVPRMEDKVAQIVLAEQVFSTGLRKLREDVSLAVSDGLLDVYESVQTAEDQDMLERLKFMGKYVASLIALVEIGRNQDGALITPQSWLDYILKAASDAPVGNNGLDVKAKGWAEEAERIYDKPNTTAVKFITTFLGIKSLPKGVVQTQIEAFVSVLVGIYPEIIVTNIGAINMLPPLLLHLKGEKDAAIGKILAEQSGKEVPITRGAVSKARITFRKRFWEHEDYGKEKLRTMFYDFLTDQTAT